MEVFNTKKDEQLLTIFQNTSVQFNRATKEKSVSCLQNSSCKNSSTWNMIFLKHGFFAVADSPLWENGDGMTCVLNSDLPNQSVTIPF